MFVTLLSLLAVAQPPAPEIGQLDNGLQVVLLEDHTLPLVSVQLWLRAGSRDDPPDQPGLCDTARRTLIDESGLVWSLLAAGVPLESATLRDATRFASTVPATPEFLTFVLEHQARLVARRTPKIPADPDLLLRATAGAPSPNAPAPAAARRLYAAVFGDHPYAHPPEPAAESPPHAAPVALDDFIARHFVAAGATLFIYGDFEPTAALDLAREHFAALPAGEPPRQPYLARLPATADELRIVDNQRLGIDFAWVTPPLGASDNVALDTLMHQLCNPFDGTLTQRLRDLAAEKPRRAAAGESISATWRHESWRECGLLVLSIDLDRASDYLTHARPALTARDDDEQRLAAVAAALEQELATATTRIVGEVPFNHARTLVASDLRAASSTFAARAARYATAEVVGGNAGLAWLPAARLPHLSVAELCGAAEFLGETRRVIAFHRPPADTANSSPAAAPSSSPAGEPAAALDNFDVFARLHGLRAAVPPTPQLARVPRAVHQRTSAGLPVVACSLPHWGSVTTLLAIAPIPGRGMPPAWRRPFRITGAVEAPNRPTARDLRNQEMASYLSYHGIAAFLSDGVLTDAPPDRLANALELAFELASADAPTAKGSVVGAGELTAAALCDALPHPLAGPCSPAQSPPAPATSGPAAEASVTEAQPTAVPAQPIRTFWKETTAPDAPPRVEILVFLHRGRESLREETDHFAADVLTVLLGGVAQSEAAPELPLAWRVEHAVPWSWRPTCELDWPALVPAVERMHARLNALRDGTLDDDTLATAARLARVSRVLALDGPDAIVYALWSGREQPWELATEVTPPLLRERVAALLRAAHIDIFVTTGPEPHAGRTQLERLLGSAP